jgi:hypothetical protein
LTKDNTDLGGIFGISIEKGLSKAIEELVLCARVAMSDSHEIISDGEDALLTDLTMIKVYTKFCLSN